MNCKDPCLFCGSTQGQVFVHGHYQCVSCGQNVMPCCEGAPSEQGIYTNQQKGGKADPNFQSSKKSNSWNKSW